MSVRSFPRRLSAKLAAALLGVVLGMALAVSCAQAQTTKPSARTRLDVTERAVASPDSVEIPVRWVLTGGAAVDSITQRWGWSGGDTRSWVSAVTRVPKYADGTTGTRWRVIPKARAGATLTVWACHYLWRSGRLVGDTTGYCASRKRVSVLGDPTGIRQLVAPGWSGSQTMQVVVSVTLPTQTRAALVACSDSAGRQSDPLAAIGACRRQLRFAGAPLPDSSVVFCAYAVDTGGVVWVHRSRTHPSSCQPLFDRVRNGNP